MARRPSSVCLSVRPSVNFCENRFFSHAIGWIATKLAHDGLQVSVHPGCAQGQGQGQDQRSRDTRTFLDSWNELYSVIDGLVSEKRFSLIVSPATYPISYVRLQELA